MRLPTLLPLAGFAVASIASCTAQTFTPTDPPDGRKSQQSSFGGVLKVVPTLVEKPIDPLASFSYIETAEKADAKRPNCARQPGPKEDMEIAWVSPSAQNSSPARPTFRPYYRVEARSGKAYGSTYIPVDSWVYTEMTRLYSLGFGNTLFLNMRPWTRQSLQSVLEETEPAVLSSDNPAALEILAALKRELKEEDMAGGLQERGLVYGAKSIYMREMGIAGQTLRDSYHLGQTIVNDYGRPYEPGSNQIAGFSTIAEWRRFSLDVRGEYQHSPSAGGYSQFLSSELSQGATSNGGDGIAFSGGNLHQATIPTGPIPSVNTFRLQEAALSFHLLGHEISGGKSDAWLGPAKGGSLAWSNNAENIYSFRINRVDPLYIPLVSRLLGPLRYDFFYGSLKGHTAPNDDWTHSTMFAFRPTNNFEFGFQRTVIFGGKGHEPVTIHTFLKSFFDINDTTAAEKLSRNDPGARYSDFNLSYRLPFVRKYATFYVDSIAHDDVTPISAPRRAAYRTGIYVSQLPGARRLDLRVEGVSTDPNVSRSYGGTFNYYEAVQRQAYTNKGFIMGDWIGRQAKGGQAWITYNLSGQEWIQLEYLNKKTPRNFIPGAYNPLTNTYGPGGTTQNSLKAAVVKRFLHGNVELNGWFQYERWKAPIYLVGPQHNTAVAVQLTLYPGLKRITTR